VTTAAAAAAMMIIRRLLRTRTRPWRLERMGAADEADDGRTDTLLGDAPLYDEPESAPRLGWERCLLKISRMLPLRFAKKDFIVHLLEPQSQFNITGSWHHSFAVSGKFFCAGLFYYSREPLAAQYNCNICVNRSYYLPQRVHLTNHGIRIINIITFFRQSGKAYKPNLPFSFINEIVWRNKLFLCDYQLPEKNNLPGTIITKDRGKDEWIHRVWRSILIKSGTTQKPSSGCAGR